jgi:hypothetical protein
MIPGGYGFSYENHETKTAAGVFPRKQGAAAWVHKRSPTGCPLRGKTNQLFASPIWVLCAMYAMQRKADICLIMGIKNCPVPLGLARFLTATSELFLRFKNRAKRTYGVTLQSDYKINSAKPRNYNKKNCVAIFTFFRNLPEGSLPIKDNATVTMQQGRRGKKRSRRLRSEVGRFSLSKKYDNINKYFLLI